MHDLDEVPCPVLVSDHDGVIVSCNKALTELTGKDTASLVGQPMQDLFTVPSRVFLQTHLWPMVLHDGSLNEVKLEAWDTQGARTPLFVNCRRVSATGGDIYYWVLFVSRERSRFELQLLEARNHAQTSAKVLIERERALTALSNELLATQEKVRMATESGGIGIWEFNLQTNALVWDAQSYRLYGLEPNSNAATYTMWSSCLHPEDLAKAEADFQRCLATDTDFLSEFRVVWGDGSVHHLRGFGRLHKDEAGQVVRIVGTNMDVTAAHAYAQSLKDARDKAEVASASKGQFLANMSHEIRTPMNAILGMLHLLQSTELTRRQKDYANKTEGAAQSLLGLLNDILDFSKVDAGKMKLEHEPMRFEAILRHLAVVLSANVGDKNIEVLFDIDPALPELVMGDALRLQQVLINLGGNAIKFTTTGDVVLAIKVQARSDSEVVVKFSVQDSGIGIAPEHQEHIFSGFSQAEASTTRRFGGTGLGLAICKRLVALMGGEIRIDSTLGLGSTFSFIIMLPIATDQTVAADAVETTNQTSDDCSALVIDDSPTAGSLLVRMLESLGWHVELASSGTQALDLLVNRTAAREHSRARPYDVVYVDWQMPGLDGWETTARLQKWCAANGITPPRTVMLTAHGRENLMQRSVAEQTMLHGFLVKPVTAAMLREAAEDSTNHQYSALRSAQGRSSQRQLRGMRILVVEDNLINQQVAEELLMSEGALVSLAGNGLLGFEAVRAATPQFDVVLMDIQMPVLDGYGATKRIRQELGLSDLAIVAMTANAMPGDREICLASGMNDHVGKPFDMAQLVSLLIRITGLIPGQADTHSVTLNPREENPGIIASPAVDLETQKAIARMGGLTSLYVRAAQEFAKSLLSVVAELQPLLESGAHAKARMLLHTLKGNAGMVGATELSREAGQLEAVCAAASIEDRIDIPLTLLDTLIHRTAAALAQSVKVLCPENSADAERRPIPLTAAAEHRKLDLQTVAALDDLISLLRESDLSALQRFSELRESLQALPAGALDALDAALQNLDLDQALSLCHQCLGK